MLAVIPARGGSKGIPRKNITLLGGKPLISYSIEAAKRSKSLDRVIVSTDDDEIAKVSRDFGAEVLMRPAHLSQDKSSTHSVLLHVVEELSKTQYNPKVIMTLQPTSPFRTEKHIDEAAALFYSDPSADSLVSCVQLPHQFHPRSVMVQNLNGYLEPFFKGSQPTRRQDKNTIYARNGAAIYITRAASLSSYIFGGRCLPYIMDMNDSIDIDQLSDLLEAEQRILKKGSVRTDQTARYSN